MEKSSRRKAKYGKKTGIVSDATTAVFGKEDELPATQTGVLKTSTPKPTLSARTPNREALEDVTELLKNVAITETPPAISTKPGNFISCPLSPRRSPRRAPAAPSVEDLASTLNSVVLEEPQPILDAVTATEGEKFQRKHRSTRRRSHLTSDTCSALSVPAVISKASKPDVRLKWLKPLIDAYQRQDDPEHMISIQSWDTLLDPEWFLSKIAESSYAEVYKVANDHGTSILKIMSLKPPSGPGSQRETSIPIEMVLSEVMIMNMMADLDGFVEFKEAHVIEGRPPSALQRAFDAFAEEQETYFPRPNSYHKGQLFLVLELGDAGKDVEHFEFMEPAQLWDLFLGVVTALATGEQAFGFEHRDLHEGNVCLKQVDQPKSIPKNTVHRQGYSGLQITLLDYTLSRASNTSQTLFLDLEKDPEIFASTKILQHQMYRRMRNWIFFRTHGVNHPLFDSPDAPQAGSWEEFEPYTNVIWLWYILQFVLGKYTGSMVGKKAFLRETEEVRHLLHPDVRAYDGGFEDVLGVYEYCIEKGWLLEEMT